MGPANKNKAGKNDDGKLEGMIEKLEEIENDLTSIKKTLEEVKRQNELLKEENERKDRVIKELKEEMAESMVKTLKIEERMEKNVVNEERIQSYAKVIENQKDLKSEVKDVIRKNPKLIRETVEMNKSVVIFGVKEMDIPNRIEKDKVEMQNIKGIMSAVAEDNGGEPMTVEEFYRIGKFEKGKNRPLKVTLTSVSKMETLMRNAKNVKKDDKMKDVWISRCLNKEDREKLKQMVTEAKKKNAERTEEEEKHFFYKVVGLQVRRWYKSEVQGVK